MRRGGEGGGSDKDEGFGGSTRKMNVQRMSTRILHTPAKSDQRYLKQVF